MSDGASKAKTYSVFKRHMVYKMNQEKKTQWRKRWPWLGSYIFSWSSDSYLDVLLELGLVLAWQLLMLPLELGDEDLPLDLLLLLQGQQLLLQLLLAHGGRHHTATAAARAGWLLAGRGERRHLLLLLVMVHAQVHGDGGRRETQGQRWVDVHWKRQRWRVTCRNHQRKTERKERGGKEDERICPRLLSTRSGPRNRKTLLSSDSFSLILVNKLQADDHNRKSCWNFGWLQRGNKTKTLQKFWMTKTLRCVTVFLKASDCWSCLSGRNSWKGLLQSSAKC